jgi:hypothetical protein
MPHTWSYQLRQPSVEDVVEYGNGALLSRVERSLIKLRVQEDGSKVARIFVEIDGCIIIWWSNFTYEAACGERRRYDDSLSILKTFIS